MYGEYSDNAANIRMYGNYGEAVQEEYLVNLLLQPQDGQKLQDVDKNSNDSMTPQIWEGVKDEALDLEKMIRCN